MAAVRPLTMFAILLTGCGLSQTTQIGRNTTIENSFPSGYPAARSQAPAEPTAVPPAIEQASANLPLKKNEAQVRVVAAVGTDTVITDDEVWMMVKQKPEQYATLQGRERSAKENELFKAELKQLIAREMIIADFMAKVKKNKPGAPEEIREICRKEAERNLRVLKGHLKAKSDDEFVQILGALGVTEAHMKRQYERNVMVDVFVGPTIRDRVKAIGLAELREYYDTHPDEFRTADRANWLYLTVLASRFKTPEEARQYADWIADEATRGVDFVELVKQYGMGDSSLRGGEGIGEKRGEIQPKELEEPIFALRKAGQVSRPIPTVAGYHVVKVVERDVAGMKPFDEKVQAECRARLSARIQKQEVDRLTDDLWRKYRPQVFELPK
jgi:peptidyl-prolyl cis-trans isomerase SurA